MTLYDAYLKARNKARLSGDTLLISCRDFGDFWGFGFMPPTYDPDVATDINGGGYDTVNKETGETGFFIPPMDLELFLKAKFIPIEQFAEKGTTPKRIPAPLKAAVA